MGASHNKHKTQTWCEGFRAAEMPPCRVEAGGYPGAAGRGECPAAAEKDAAKRWEQPCLQGKVSRAELAGKPEARQGVDIETGGHGHGVTTTKGLMNTFQ